jgi:hypothetical protein
VLRRICLTALAIAVLSATTPVLTTNAPSESSNAGTLEYVASKREYHLFTVYNGSAADIWSGNARPGVTWGPFNLTNGKLIYWTNPVATSSVTGT